MVNMRENLDARRLWFVATAVLYGNDETNAPIVIDTTRDSAMAGQFAILCYSLSE